MLTASDSEPAPAPARVAVSIINYRTGAMTCRCIESVLAELAAPGAPDAEVVVIDNASEDGSAEEIERWIAAHPGVPVRLIRSPVNGGFSAGHNLGIAATASDYVLVLNSDAFLGQGCLSALVRAAEADPGAGIVSPRLEDSGGNTQIGCFRFPSAMSEVIRGAATGPVTQILRRWNVPLGPDPDPSRIEWVSFACVLLRRSMIDRIGPMDDGYFLYFEDVEYCLRASRAGWSIRHVPEARVRHDEGGSGPGPSPRAAGRIPAYVYESRSRFFYQKSGYAGLLAANLGWLAGRAIARARALFGKPVPAAPHGEWRGLWRGLATAPAGRVRGERR